GGAATRHSRADGEAGGRDRRRPPTRAARRAGSCPRLV
ncbi:MAG: hypothetical protein AVDCRST_MAG40-2653, partial [uncultured Gemmatimonadaceae bacterium]